MVRRLLRVRGWGVLLAWAMVVAVLVMAFAAPVRATSLATHIQSLSLPDQLRTTPVVLYTATPCDTAGHVATAPADQVHGLAPKLLATSDGCTMAVHSTLPAPKQLRMASGMLLALPLGH